MTSQLIGLGLGGVSQVIDHSVAKSMTAQPPESLSSHLTGRYPQPTDGPIGGCVLPLWRGCSRSILQPQPTGHNIFIECLCVCVCVCVILTNTSTYRENCLVSGYIC